MTDPAITSTLEAGDVLFFRWAGWDLPANDPSADKDFENFAQLAGYAQNLAYEDGHGRYWHHCGVMVTPTVVAQFGQTDSPEGSNWSPTLTLTPIDRAIPEGQTFDVMHCADAAVCRTLVDGSLRLVAAQTPYSVASLLGFAFATQRRLFVAGDARNRLGGLAAGAHVVAMSIDSSGPPHHTCVSAVLDALGEATYREPAPRLSPVIADLAAADLLEPVFDRLLTRVRKGSVALGVEQSAGEALSTQEVQDGYGIFVTKDVPGLIQTTQDYLTLIKSTITSMYGSQDADDLETLGAGRPILDDAVPAVLVSPAMLYDRLLELGFEQRD